MRFPHVDTVFFKRLYVFFVIEIATRRVHPGITPTPPGPGPPSRPATAHGPRRRRRPRYLIRDRDSKFTPCSTRCSAGRHRESSKRQSGRQGRIPLRSAGSGDCAANASNQLLIYGGRHSSNLAEYSAALQRAPAPPVAGTTTSAAQARPAGRYERPDQAQTGCPGPDQRVPESSLTSTENARSEPVCEFWHGTGLRPASARSVGDGQQRLPQRRGRLPRPSGTSGTAARSSSRSCATTRPGHWPAPARSSAPCHRTGRPVAVRCLAHADDDAAVQHRPQRIPGRGLDLVQAGQRHRAEHGNVARVVALGRA